ncbi:MAG: hypothetical protein AAGD43_03315 [Pseudomonadota bacterium]
MSTQFDSLGDQNLADERFAVSPSTKLRWGLNTAKVKLVMSQAWADTRSNLANVTSVRIATA